MLRMRARAWRVVLAALTTAALARSLDPCALASSEPTGLEARGTLRVVTTPEEYPEWFSLEAGADPGFERELLEGFAQLHRLKLEVVTVPSFDLVIPALLEGRGDLIAGIIDTPARRKQVAFTKEVLPSRYLAIALRPHAAPRTIEELRTRKVGVVAGTTWAEVARQYVSASQVVSFNRADEVIAALRAGRVTSSVVTFSEYLATRRRVPELEGGVLIGERASAAWAVRQADTELRTTLDGYLSLKKQSMGFSRLLVKYFGADAPALLDRAAQ